MAADEVLLQQACHHERLFMRVYAWDQPAVSFGYFQSHDQICELTQVRPLVRRWTAGAGVACRRLDVCFGHPCLSPMVFPEGKLLPDAPVGSSIPCGIGLEPFLAAPILKGARPSAFLGAEQDDVLLDGFKVAGAAQRRSRRGF